MIKGMKVRCTPFSFAAFCSLARRSHSSVTSASSMPVTNAADLIEAMRFFAIAFLTPFIGTRSIKPNLSEPEAASLGVLEAALVPPAAASTSDSVTIPACPVPFTDERSMPSFFASALAFGEASTSTLSGIVPTTEAYSSLGFWASEA